LKREAEMKLSAEEWSQYSKIRETFDGQRRFERRSYELEYQTRFEIARKRRIDEAGKKDRKLAPRWFGIDGFDRAAIDRQAHRDVRASHLNAMAALEEQEVTRLNGFLESCGHRRDLREKPMRDFERATDRRVADRRQRPSRWQNR